MPSFGDRSIRHFDTLDERLQRVMSRAIKDGPDFSIICGHRSNEDQEIAYKTGASKKRPGYSKHNRMPSIAVDILPYGGRDVWSDHIRFGLLAGWVLRCAFEEDVPIRWGGDWRENWRENYSSFFDGGHFEIMED